MGNPCQSVSQFLNVNVGDGNKDTMGPDGECLCELSMQQELELLELGCSGKNPIYTVYEITSCDHEVNVSPPKTHHSGTSELSVDISVLSNNVDTEKPSKVSQDGCFFELSQQQKLKLMRSREHKLNILWRDVVDMQLKSPCY